MKPVRLSSRDAILVRHYLLAYQRVLSDGLSELFNSLDYSEFRLISDLLQRKFKNV